jgi:hypothetical protein
VALGVLLLVAGLTRIARAQSPEPHTDPATAGDAAPAALPSAVDETSRDPAEPDFVVVNIPTTLRLPRHKGSFRLTHRFAGNLRSGTFSQQASNLFGIDQGAVIGFEYRFAVMRRLHAAAYRSGFDKTIQLYGKYDALRQQRSFPVSLSGLASVEGVDNFQEQYAPAFGVAVSREVADRLAVYAAPIWVNNSAGTLGSTGGRRNTLYLGLAARARVSSAVYLVGEVTPRAAGYAPSDAGYGFGIEKRVGAHVFQLTFTNTFATTFGQLARGGSPGSLYLGLNLARKFF